MKLIWLLATAAALVFEPMAAGTFLMLCRNSDLYDVLETLVSVEDRYNRRFHHDYVFLNDQPFTPAFREAVAAVVRPARARFGQVPPEHWSYPPWLDMARAKYVQHNSPDVWYGSSESYRHMCRFYTGFFAEHELLDDYEFFWRLEPGTRLLCDVDGDVFADMRAQNRSYGFTMTMFEYANTIPTLWDTFNSYKATHDYNGELLSLVQNDDAVNSYNLCHFWTNFEVARISMFRSPEYREFFRHFDAAGGFYYERWGDAPLHTLFVSLHLEKSQVVWFKDIGYQHIPYMQCPQDHERRLANRCFCDPEEDFSFTYQSCTSHFISILNS